MRSCCGWSAGRRSRPSSVAQLGWLLLPAEQAVEIWRGAGTSPPECLQPAVVLDGGDLFTGLRLELSEVPAG